MTCDVTSLPDLGLIAPASIVDGSHTAVAMALDIGATRHRSACLSLRYAAPIDLVSLVYDLIADNWRRASVGTKLARSTQNWRWKLQPQLGISNQSPEIVLEKAIAAACAARSQSDWANQVPVASGLLPGAAGGRRAIDLIHSRSDRHFEFIELKIANYTPLYAVVELLEYTSIWLLTRASPLLSATNSALLRANRVDIRVLAPAGFFEGFANEALEMSVDKGVRALGENHGVQMSFGFDVLPDRLIQRPLPGGDDLMALIAQRRPLNGRAWLD